MKHISLSVAHEKIELWSPGVALEFTNDSTKPSSLFTVTQMKPARCESVAAFRHQTGVAVVVLGKRFMLIFLAFCFSGLTVFYRKI